MQKQQKTFGLICIAWLMAIIFSSSAYALASRPVPDGDVFDIPESLPAEARTINEASSLISKGDFDSAGDLIKEEFGDDPAKLEQEPKEILEIVSNFDDIAKQREEIRDKAYADRVTKLDEYKELKGTGDPNEPNDNTVILSAIVDIKPQGMKLKANG